MFIKGLNTQNLAEYIHRPQNKPLHYETDSILYCIWNSTAEISSKWSPHPSMIRYAEAGCSKWWLTFAQRTNKANLIFTLCNKYFSQLLFCAAAVQTVLQQITQLEAKKFLLLIGYIDFSQSVHWFSQRRGERWKFMSLVCDFFFHSHVWNSGRSALWQISFTAWLVPSSQSGFPQLPSSLYPPSPSNSRIIYSAICHLDYDFLKHTSILYFNII